ncbi:hypothetical protein A2Y85_05895 [candidate division WOR-3 bacterium RBG_13_43_14]|uniref:Aspartate racemase n=1 Tax=candidate division WOR-3 bacterium RBG_13_43_14 TaxID=1802590 RepID=A0A1F4U932_UNCW3|nr:MAG: hypothetical protein A2Y85_05895 [candidate division WOR-3 bacterium RBG_13_43_14]
MKKIGIIGGLGPEATVDYYRILINAYRERFGGKTPEIIIYSLDMGELATFFKNKDLNGIVNWLNRAIKALKGSGADLAIIAANTPHLVYEDLVRVAPIPVISIVEETANVASTMGLKRVGLFGTKITMRADFYPKVFKQKNIDIAVPTKDEQNYINRILNEELNFGTIREETRGQLKAIIQRMIKEQGINALILGCTELPLILSAPDPGIPYLNTSRIHVLSALRYALQ